MSEIKDLSLFESGEMKIGWVRSNMPLLSAIEAEFRRDKPFAGLRIGLSVHLEAKTAYLCRVLAAGGAEMYVTGSNPLSTQDDVAAALVHGGLRVFAEHGATKEKYARHIAEVVRSAPNIIIDDGGDLVNLLHNSYPELIRGVLGGCEETTTGIMRLKAMERDGSLKFPMLLVNDARCKYLFDNRYGTGQSVWDGINRTTNLIVAGKNVVVAGYGWCGKGIAKRAQGLGASVIVTEIDPVKAIEAVMDGFKVMKMRDAARVGDVFVTATGCCGVISEGDFLSMKDGALLCNAGHFNVEVDMACLEKLAVTVSERRSSIKGYALQNGRTLNVIAEGRLVNLAAGDGHPAEIMDMSFAIQALCARSIAENAASLRPGTYAVPEAIDRRVALMKLAAWGLEIDRLTPEQEKYLNSWNLS